MRNHRFWGCLLLLIVVGCGDDAERQSSEQPAGGEQEAAAAAVPAKGDDEQEVAAVPAPKPQELLTAEEIVDGWVELFDGATLYGWTPNNDVNWSVVDGVITADAGEPGLLLTNVPFRDFELRCDVRLESGGNSGIFLRTVRNPADPAVDCYELNLTDDNPFPTGSFVKRAKIATPVRVEGEWHTFHARCVGNLLTVKLDGETIFEFEDTSEHQIASGFIGLQKNSGKVEFRHVAVKPVGMTDLFSGKDLSGWREVPGGASEFTVADGTIHVKDGAGFLETESAYDNFILQFAAKTNGDELNSGIFFRAMPGTEEAPSNGYEVQIHNGATDGDRSRPSNAGTGAIFRRTEARWVVADDHEWAYVTLIANGPRIATWVNGYQTVDWVDERKPDENPRRGLRLEAGHLSLQGHDPTTDLNFKDLRVQTLPAGE